MTMSMPHRVLIHTAVREEAAFRLYGLGHRLLNAAARLSPTIMTATSWDSGFRDGRDAGRRDIVELMVTGDTEISVVGRLIMDYGMTPREVLAHLDETVDEGRPAVEGPSR